MNKPQKVMLDFSFNKRKSRLSLARAITLVEDYLEAERKACQRLTVKINGDYRLRSFAAEVNSERYPPKWEDWGDPINECRSARSALRGRNIQAAKKHLKRGVAGYNRLHNKWAAYRVGLEGGGERVKSIMEITFAAMTAVATGGYCLGASLTVIESAGLATATKGIQAVLMQRGEVEQGLDDKIDWRNVGIKMAEEGLTSLASGAMSKGLLRIIAPRLTKTFKIAPDIAVKLFSKGTKSQQFAASLFTGTLLNFTKEAVKKAAAKANARDLTATNFLNLIVDEYTSKLAKDEATKQLIDDLIKSYGK